MNVQTMPRGKYPSLMHARLDAPDARRAPGWLGAKALFGVMFLSHASAICTAEPVAPRPYRLAPVNLKERVIWGSVCEAPDGTALSFGGEDQAAGDGSAHTRLRVNGEWIELEDELTKANPLRDFVQDSWELVDSQKHTLAIARTLYLEGLAPGELAHRVAAEVLPRQKRLSAEVHDMVTAMTRKATAGEGVTNSIRLMESIGSQSDAIVQTLQKGPIDSDTLAHMRQIQVRIAIAGDVLYPEPPARALSAITYEPKTKMFVLFGGDHCDYLTNDTWVFDPAVRRWALRHPTSAPAPRADHGWKSTKDGKLILTGGYTYSSDTQPMGGQYVDLNDGDWTYDVVADTWSGSGKPEPADSRTYRTGAFLPEFFFAPPAPDAAEFQAKLSSLPANVWTRTNPPKLPRLDRDGGSAVIDSDRDLILRFCGGHNAHAGSDVIEYHLASNRWELCYPVEFPLGQLYTGEYPDGVNFNHRPWVSDHADPNYGVDPNLRKMIFLGHPPTGYQYDPSRGEWTSRGPLPEAMSDSGSDSGSDPASGPGAISTLVTTPTPSGLICWTGTGRLFAFDSLLNRWSELSISGEKLPGAVTDNSSVAYDARRDRLLFVRKPAGEKAAYDGEIYSIDMKSLQASRLSPVGKEAALAIPYLCQIRSDPAHDLLLAGATLPPDADGFRRTPAYDCANDKWVSLKIAGDDPSGPRGRNGSLGLVYDARRNLFWAVDARSNVFVLRLDPKSADVKDLAAR